ncbi:unnamed protein product [Orchesella dallaii]|uniref:Uncharacterized protein n=1 Tax=Orchesella dallaii TaxID=48710 RepID=A0ABP1QP09_9HEXA
MSTLHYKDIQSPKSSKSSHHSNYSRDLELVNKLAPEKCEIHLLFYSATRKSPIPWLKVKKSKPKLAMEILLHNLVQLESNFWSYPTFTILIRNEINFPRGIFLAQGSRESASLYETIRSTILISTKDSQLLLLCLICSLGDNRRKQQALTINMFTLKTISEIRKLERHLLNFHTSTNRKNKEKFTSLLESCSNVRKLRDELLIYKHIRPWATDCISASIRQKYNDSIFRQGRVKPPIGMKFDKIVETVNRFRNLTFNITRKSRERFKISGHCFQHDGLIYKVFVRSSNNALDYKALIKPFDTMSWTMSAITFLLVSATLHTIGKMKNSLLWVYSVALEQDQGFKLNYKTGTIIIIWIWVAFLLRNAYNSSVFSYLTKERLPNVPETLMEIVDGGSKSIPLIINGNVTFDKFPLVNDGGSNNLKNDSGTGVLALAFVNKLRKRVKNIHRLLQFTGNIAYNQPFTLYDLESLSTVSWKVPLDFAVLMPSRELEVFQFLLSAFNDVGRGTVVISNKFHSLFPEEKSWVLLDNFLSTFFHLDVSMLVESGLYDRWLSIRKAARMITLLRTDPGISTDVKKRLIPKCWMALMLEQEECLKRHDNVVPANLESFKLVFMLLAVCLSISFFTVALEVVK